MLQIILTCPVIITLAIAKLILSIWHLDITPFIILYSSVIGLLDVFLMVISISDLRKKAAKAQEEFDCYVYDLSWNKSFTGNKNPVELTNKYCSKFIEQGGNISKLLDWYPVELRKHPDFKAIIYCQRTNLVYDTDVRHSFKRLALVISVFPIIILLIFSVIINSNINDLFISIAVFWPLVMLAIKIWVDQNKVINYSDETKNIIDGLLADPNKITEDAIRNIQNRIYCNRKDSALIPERFYNRIRKQLEKEMHHNAIKVS